MKKWLTIFLLFFPICSQGFSQELNEEVPSEAMTLGQLILNGGPIMVVIMALSIVTLFLIIRYFFIIRPSAMVPKDLIQEVSSSLSSGNKEKSLTLCNNNPGFLSEIIKAGIENSADGREEVEEAMERAGHSELALLQQNVRYLADIGVIAPMLGLLGTVLGMIKAFLMVAFQTGIVRDIMIAGGISQALVTTAAGLIVGIPAMAFYFFFRSRLQRISIETENTSADILKIILKKEAR